MSAPTFARPKVTPEAVASALLWMCAIAAALAAISGVGTVLAADPGTRFVELWREVGFVTFSILFAAVAWAPRTAPTGVWVALIVNKLILTAVGVAWAASAAGAGSAMWWDGALTVLLVTAFALTRSPR